MTPMLTEPREWMPEDALARALDTLTQTRRAVSACYVISPDIDADDLAIRQADYDAALSSAMEIILSNVQNQAAMTIIALALAPHGTQTTTHLDVVVDRLVALLAPIIAQKLAEAA